MKIFISSTIYELIDLRAELKLMLDSYKIDSIFSEIANSGFIVDFSKSSIESCLINIKGCDYFILILDRRYGPSLIDNGYEDISATHLEYRKAIELNMNVLLFIRDKTLAEYTIYRKLIKKDEYNGNWVNRENIKLFSFFDEHSKLQDKNNNNWYYTFSTSIDLKKSIIKYLRKTLVEENLPSQIAHNELPNLVLDYKIINSDKSKPNNFIFEYEIMNTGKTAAFINTIKFEDSIDKLANKIILPNEVANISFFSNVNNTFTNRLILAYSTFDGINIKDVISIIYNYGTIAPNCFTVQLIPTEKEYRIIDPVKIEIKKT